jgi:enoyl-CoA hydratase/carnithine racemase
MPAIIDNIYFVASKHDHLAIITFKANVFDLITNVQESQLMMDFIRETEHDKDIKGLLLLNEPGCLGEQEYDRFLHSIMKEENISPDMEAEAILERNVRFRQISILSRFIRYLAGYQKLCIAGLDCTVVTPFIGIILVADLRYATRHATFSFAHNKYGLHPTGALPFFLTHYLGHAKAMEVLLSERMGADEALSLGLISHILPEDNFKDNCIRAIKPYLPRTGRILSI